MQSDHNKTTTTPLREQNNIKKNGEAHPAQRLIKAMIFDMDGTVVNSIENDFAAWTKIFKKYEVEFSYQSYLELSGAKGTEIVDKYLDLSDEEKEALIQKKEEFFKALSEERGLEAMPYIIDILKQAKALSFKVALATGGLRSKVDFMLEKIGLVDYFDNIVTANDLHRGKPDPEIFLKAAEKLNVRPEEAVVWEDARLGVKAAKNGNFKCVAITTTQKGKRAGLEEADMVVDSYKDINLSSFLKNFS